MATVENFDRSGVTVLEAPDAFVLQLRPDLPGKLAYPNMLQPFGGGAHDGEPLNAVAARELTEETDLDGDLLNLTPVWEGIWPGKDKHGKPVNRHVGLFHALIETSDVTCTDGGKVVTMPKTWEAVEAHRDRLTPFAHFALLQVLFQKGA